MHIAPYIDKFGYKFVNGLTVGAAVGFTEEQFVAVNGYSNEYAVSSLLPYLLSSVPFCDSPASVVVVKSTTSH